jgi:AhpD family alkylhydroperoxidase
MVIRYISSVKPGHAEGLVADVYTQVQRDFGKVVEPFQMHSFIPKLLAGVWIVCRETELVGIVPRVLKEVIAASVSQLNRCPYCVDAHTIILASAGENKISNAISNARYEEILDPKIFLTVKWALATTSPRSEQIRSFPFSHDEAPEIIGTAVFYHYMNRMANILLGESPLPFSQNWLKKPLKKVAGTYFSDAVNRNKTPGESLKFMPKTDLPNDLRWTMRNPNIARSYAILASAIEETGEQALPLEVRAHVEEELSNWNGTISELGLAWSEDAINHFDEAMATAARLAVLTALAPDRVDRDVILAFKKHFPEDTKLLGALSWASFAAARRIGTWL